MQRLIFKFSYQSSFYSKYHLFYHRLFNPSKHCDIDHKIKKYLRKLNNFNVIFSNKSIFNKIILWHKGSKHTYCKYLLIHMQLLQNIIYWSYIMSNLGSMLYCLSCELETWTYHTIKKSRSAVNITNLLPTARRMKLPVIKARDWY